MRAGACGTGRLRVGRSWSPKLRQRGTRPVIELPVQTGPEPEPDAATQNPSSTDSYRVGAYQAHARRTWIGAEPNEGRSRTGQDFVESDVLSVAA